MRKSLIPILALTLLAAGCGKATNEAAEANEISGGDSNTMGEAVADVDAANAATEAAFGEAENSYANAASDANENEITD
jgi:hypothetical protein